MLEASLQHTDPGPAMTISTATTEVRRHVGERDLTVAGLVVTAVRVTVQQAVGQAGTDAGRTAGSAADGMLQGHLRLGEPDGLQAAWAQLAGAASTLDGWTFGLAGFLVLLVLPLGGPVWAGVVPVGTTVAGVRAGWTIVRVIRNARGRTATHHGLVPLTILIVDDSAPFRDLAERILARDGLTVVGTAATGAEALATAASLRPQVALVDVNLGAESGFEVARQLRPAGTRQPSVVLMSTHSADEFADLIAQSPAVGFLPKESLSGDAVRVLVAGA
jgi:CheY-like chemotaxis protein